MDGFAALGISRPLVGALARLGYVRPTPIQTRFIPPALAGEDVIGLAETGSGKTAAYAVPVLQRPPRAFGALVLVPTRELAMQVGDAIRGVGSGVEGLDVLVLVGGVNRTQQALALARRPHVLVATPGRVRDHLDNTKGFSLRTLAVLVLDEADKLLSPEFAEDVTRIIHMVPRERQTLMLSATMTDRVARFQQATQRHPVRVDVTDSAAPLPAALERQYVACFDQDKELFLYHVMGALGGRSCVVFCNAARTVVHVSVMLRLLGVENVFLYGDMSQAERTRTLEHFRDAVAGAEGSCVLVATDVAGRGIDIPDMACVVHFDFPAEVDTFVHRSGRCGRAGRGGLVVAFVTENDVEALQRTEAALGFRMTNFLEGVPDAAVRANKDAVIRAVSDARRIVRDEGLFKKRK